MLKADVFAENISKENFAKKSFVSIMVLLSPREFRMNITASEPLLVFQINCTMVALFFFIQRIIFKLAMLNLFFALHFEFTYFC